ncbi:hypothetical protein KIPB_013690, partial [Kipferlia bialata]|eukprot:g13690.t1
MYIYQESWKSVLQPSTYTRLKTIHTSTLLALGMFMVVARVYVTVYSQRVSPEEYYSSSVFTVFNLLYLLTMVHYALECVCMSVLWGMAYKFRRLLPPSHQPTVLGVK